VRVLKAFIFLFLTSCQYCYSQYWQPLQAGLNNGGSTKLYADSVADKLYVGGHFTLVNNQTQWGIASWDGTQWDSLGCGMDDLSIGNQPGSTSGMVRYGNHLYTGGSFRKAGGLNTPALARWDGISWDTVPGTAMDQMDLVHDIIVHNNELYICGSFDSVGNSPASCVAKWDGTNWQAISSYSFSYNNAPMNLYKIQFYHGNLYVIGGFFDPWGNVCRMAKWDGIAWTFFTYSFPASTNVTDMEVYNDKLYVCGSFTMSEGKNAIMTWNDTVWSGVGGGTQIVTNQTPTISDVTVHNGKLYCVGSFEKIGGVPATGLASWDGMNWCGYNSFFATANQFCGAGNIEFYHDTMYVGGVFKTLNGDTVNGIAKWIGGSYVDSCGVLTTGIFQEEAYSSDATVYPNPASKVITFQFSGSHQSRSLIIYDQLGREILREETNENMISLSVESFAEGMYFYKVIQDGSSSATGKFIVTH